MKKFSNNQTFIIAEAGINHNGNFNLAKKLIIAAKKAGADLAGNEDLVKEIESGKSKKEAVAIAMSKAGKGRPKKKK